MRPDRVLIPANRPPGDDASAAGRPVPHRSMPVPPGRTASTSACAPAHGERGRAGGHHRHADTRAPKKTISNTVSRSRRDNPRPHNGCAQHRTPNSESRCRRNVEPRRIATECKSHGHHHRGPPRESAPGTTAAGSSGRISPGNRGPRIRRRRRPATATATATATAATDSSHRDRTSRSSRSSDLNHTGRTGRTSPTGRRYVSPHHPTPMPTRSIDGPSASAYLAVRSYDQRTRFRTTR